MAEPVYAVVVRGLADLGLVAQLSDSVLLDAARAINAVAPSIRTESARAILGQVNFPNSYLNPSAKRLYVSRLAKRGNLEAAITARRRPTSLARFVKGSLKDKQVGGMSVQVEAGGKTTQFDKAFVIKLKGATEAMGNLGLAIRLPKGKAIRNRHSAVRMANGLYLLYGPSVQQVFMDNQGEGVAEDMVPLALEKLADEYTRLFDLRLR